MDCNSLTENELEVFKKILEEHSKINGDCIEWTGKCNKGYGYFRAFKHTWTVHRASFLIVNKKIKENLIICHKCNNRKCFNINHLYEGTYKDNSRDLKNAPYFHEVVLKRAKNHRENTKKREEEFRERNEQIKNIDNYFLTVQEMAKILHAHPNTILNCLHLGYIQGVRTGIGLRSSYRIPVTELARIGMVNFQEAIDKAIEERKASCKE